MDAQTLERFIRSYLDSQPDGQVMIGWQGGEPTLRGLDFFREAVRLSERHRRPGQQVQHAIQTNATLVDDEWCEFLAANDVLVGVSLDSPAWLHDVFRVNKAGRGPMSRSDVAGTRCAGMASTRPSSARSMLPTKTTRSRFTGTSATSWARPSSSSSRSWNGSPRASPPRPSADTGTRPAPTSSTARLARVTSRTVEPQAWGRFLNAIFDEWVVRDVERVFVQHFDVMLGARFGEYSLCVHAPQCGTALAMEHTGDVFSCDHYVEPDFRLGNIADNSFTELLALPQQRQFGRDKLTTMPKQCRGCPVRWACNGGCPKDRFATTADGEPGLNHLCAGYFAFFTHATPAIDAIANLILAGRRPADIMTSGGSRHES